LRIVELRPPPSAVGMEKTGILGGFPVPDFGCQASSKRVPFASSGKACFRHDFGNRLPQMIQ